MKSTSLKMKALLPCLSLVLACSLCAGCSSSQSADKASSDDSTTEQAEQATEDEAAAPLDASRIADGTYTIEVESSSSMFRIVNAELNVADGAMTCTMTLSGTGYGKLFMGTSEEAANATEDQCIPFVEDAEGKYTYTVPVEQLNADTDCAAWSIKKEKWYDRTLVFTTNGIPADSINA